MINKGAFSIPEDMSSSCPIALTTSSPSSPANDGSRSASSTFNPRTAPNCARCKNHGLKVPLKGHKRYCRYWNCVCDKCVQTSTRQKVMARETAHRRARKLHEAKIHEFREAQERARMMGERSPEMPVELQNPVMSPEVKSVSDGEDDRSISPNSLSGSGTYPLGLRRTATPTSLADDPPTSDKVDLRSSLRSLQEQLLQENFPLEISSLLYLILKDTPEPKKAFSRIVEAQSELNACYSKEEMGGSRSHVDNWPLYIGPYSIGNIARPNILAAPPFSLTHHPAFSLSPPYYHHQSYGTAGASLPIPPTCRYPYLGTISALKNTESLFAYSHSPPLAYSEEKKPRLAFDPIHFAKEMDRSLSRPSNLCIRESSSGYSQHLVDTKFSAAAAATSAGTSAAAAAAVAASAPAISESK